MNQLKNWSKVLTIALGFSLFSFTILTAAPLSEIEKVSYSIGADIGIKIKTAFAQQGVILNNQLLIEGVTNALEGKNLRFTKQEIQQILVTFQQNMQAKAQQDSLKKSLENKKKGKNFLKKNKTKSGVVTLSSGLQYKVIKQGKGKRPKVDSVVETHYKGMLLDGTVFDSSYKRGTPASFPVNGVIKGWTEALQLMPEGSKWKLFIPSDLAYGERGAGRSIPPGSTLVFEVELLQIKK